MNESQRDTDGVCGLKTHRSHPAFCMVGSGELGVSRTARPAAVLV